MDLPRTKWHDIFGSRDFSIIDVDGQFYATNHYWLAPVSEDLQRFFNWWRLPLQSGVYNIHDGRLDEISLSHVPNVRSLLDANSDVTRRVHPMKVDNLLVYVNIMAPDGVLRPHNVFTTNASGDSYIRARADYLEVAFGTDWHNEPVYQEKKNAPLVHKNPLALVMPLRETVL